MLNKLLQHLYTIYIHRKYVRKACFKMGIPWQGIVHDLSKYSLTELKIYKYYNGKRSPHQECREKLGYSPSWIHHYHKNKHHWEYWLDSATNNVFNPIKMPYKYVIESVCDMIGASKAYNHDHWNAQMPLKYWQDHNNDNRNMHPSSLALAKFLIEKLAQLNESNFYIWYRENKKLLKELYKNDCLKEDIDFLNLKEVK